MTGRPLSLTPEVKETLVEALGAGATYRDAAALAGVSPSTLFAWLARGRSERERIERGLDPDPSETPFLEFLELATVACARVAVEVNRSWLSAIRRGEWRAAAAWDERHRRAVDEPVDRLDPEKVAEAGYRAITQEQGKAVAEAMLSYAEGLLAAVAELGVEGARARKGQLARDALLVIEHQGRDI